MAILYQTAKSKSANIFLQMSVWDPIASSIIGAYGSRTIQYSSPISVVIRWWIFSMHFVVNYHPQPTPTN